MQPYRSIFVLLGCLALFPQVLMSSTADVAAGGAERLLEARLQRIETDLKNNRLQRALGDLSALRAEFPDHLQAANLYAYGLVRQGKYDAAQAVLEEALTNNAASALAFSNLRAILGHQAAVSYAKALGRSPPRTELSLSLSVDPPAPVVLAAAEPELKTKPKPEVVVAEQKPVARNQGPVAAAPPAASPAALSPAAETLGNQARARDALIIERMAGWAAAWSQKNFDAYLSFYSDQFRPELHPSRAAWVDHRRPRVDRSGSIRVDLSQFRLRELASGEIEVRFRQQYSGPNLKVSSSRFLVWRQDQGQWMIVREEGR
jgi:tetratricopeptide (TPR) repeat protein